MDTHQWMERVGTLTDVNGCTLMDGRGWTNVDGHRTKADESWTKLWRIDIEGTTMDGNGQWTMTAMNSDCDCDKWQRRLQRRQKAIATMTDADGRQWMATTLKSDPHPWALQQWHAKEILFFFLLLRVFKKKFLSSFLQRILQLVPLIIRAKSWERWK